MSIQGRFFDTLKKREIGLKALIATLLQAALSLVQTACIVTDTIEFEDKINHPPQVLSYLPTNNLVFLDCFDSSEQQSLQVQLSVKIWEPDAEDESQLSAVAIVYPGHNPVLTSENEQPDIERCEKPFELASESVEQESGVVLNIVCKRTIPTYYFREYPLLQVKVKISDFGFSNDDLVNAGARTAEVSWIIEAEECD
jgi:hypothetical protein